MIAFDVLCKSISNFYFLDLLLQHHIYAKTTDNRYIWIQTESEFFLNTFYSTKADESADCAGRWRGRLPTGLYIFFNEASQS